MIVYEWMNHMNTLMKNYHQYDSEWINESHEYINEKLPPVR